MVSKGLKNSKEEHFLFSDICQIRLDFRQLSTSYSSSSPTGCISGTTDVVSFSTPNSVSYPSVCGDVTGQHSESSGTSC